MRRAGNTSPPSSYAILLVPPPDTPDTSPPSATAGYLPLAQTVTGNPSGTAVYTVGSLIGDPATSTSSPARSYTPLFVEPVGVPGRSFRLLDLMPRINVREDDL